MRYSRVAGKLALTQSNIKPTNNIDAPSERGLRVVVLCDMAAGVDARERRTGGGGGGSSTNSNSSSPSDEALLLSTSSSARYSGEVSTGGGGEASGGDDGIVMDVPQSLQRAGLPARWSGTLYLWPQYEQAKRMDKS